MDKQWRGEPGCAQAGEAGWQKARLAGEAGWQKARLAGEAGWQKARQRAGWPGNVAASQAERKLARQCGREPGREQAGQAESRPGASKDARQQVIRSKPCTAATSLTVSQQARQRASRTSSGALNQTASKLARPCGKESDSEPGRVAARQDERRVSQALAVRPAVAQGSGHEARKLV